MPCADLNKDLIDSIDISKKRNKISKNRTKDRNSGKIISKLYPSKSAEKNFIEETLFNWSQQRALFLYGEFLFHPDRRWRFDWCIPDLKLAIEFEGIIAEKSRHTTLTGYTGDTEKYNEAAKLGWKVYRYTALNYENITEDLKQCI